MSQLKVALFQGTGPMGDTGVRIAALNQAAAEAAAAGAGLLISPELYVTGYDIGEEAVRRLAEPVDGPYSDAVGELARAHGLAVIFSYPERDGDAVYNSAACVGADGMLIANHRKLHLSGDYEKTAFVTGDDLTLFELSGVTVAMLICYDIEFPEAARACARAGAHLIAVPTALRVKYRHLAHTLIPTRAFENGLYVAYSNQCGREGTWVYCGQSCIAGPDGKDCARAGEGREVISAVVDTGVISEQRAELPFLDDVRRDL